MRTRYPASGAKPGGSMIVLALLGCHTPGDGECQVWARAPGEPVPGDGNADGVADIADGIAVEDAQFRQGTALVCPGAIDVFHYEDGSIDAAVGPTLWYWLFAGTSAAPGLS